MGQFLLKPSFAGGELTPALYGRTDLQKYDVGAALLQNAVVLRYGGVTRRAGFQYIAGTKGNNKARLIPFSYNAEQNYVLEFTAGKVRIFTSAGIVQSGGNPVEVTTPYTAAELSTIKYTQSADMLFLVQPNHPPATLTRYSATNWQYAVLNIKNGPFEDTNTTATTITPSATTGSNITLTASASYFTSSMVGQLMRIRQNVGGDYKKGDPTQTTIWTGTLNGDFVGRIIGYYLGDTVTKYDVDFDGYTGTFVNIPFSGSYNSSTGVLKGQATDTDLPGGYSKFSGTIEGTLTGTGTGSTTTDSLLVSCVPGANVYVESFGFWTGNFTVWQKIDGEWLELQKQSGNRSANYNLTFENKTDEICDFKVTSTEFDTTVIMGEDPNQRGYVTIQAFSNSYDGIVKITAVNSGTSASAEVVKELGATSATADFAITAWSSAKGYPQAVGFFEDRLVFAGSPSKPQTYWASKTGDYNNFGVSLPQQDDDAITGTLSSGQIDGIKAIVSFGEMIMLTGGGEYRVSGGSGENFTPTSQQARAQEYRGVNDLTPVVIGGRIIYVQRHGSVIRDLAYSYEVDKYTGDEISLLASHLFDGYTIVGITYQQTPDSVVWCVRSDGALLGMTYIKEQDVYAWHRHATDGKFIDVCSIPGASEDELWAVVQRGSAYSVEKMTMREDNVFVDAAYIYNSSTATNTLSGLTWLAGKTVSVLADGNKMPPLTVSNSGVLTLDRAFKRIVVGLGYDTIIRTLPVEFAGSDGTWGSRKKRIQKMMMFFSETIGGLYGLDENHLDEIKWRTTEAYGTAVKTYSGKRSVTLPQANYEDTLMLTIKQSDPFPMTILSIIPEVLPGG